MRDLLKKKIIWVFVIIVVAFFAILFIAFAYIPEIDREVRPGAENTREDDYICTGEMIRLTENDLEDFDLITLVVYGFYEETSTVENGNVQEEDTLALSVWSQYESSPGHMEILGAGDTFEYSNYHITLLEIGQQLEYPEPNGYAVICVEKR